MYKSQLKEWERSMLRKRAFARICQKIKDGTREPGRLAHDEYRSVEDEYRRKNGLLPY